MENRLAPYESQFTAEERKRIVAQALAKLRKDSGLSQKEAAAQIGVSQATYSAYERGRNEPPIEALVRLSFLFGVSVDVIVQRDRLFRTMEDAQEKIGDVKQQLKELEEQLGEAGTENPVFKDFLEAMGNLAEQLERLNESPEAQRQYEESGIK